MTCGPDGLFVGGAPMLRRARSYDGGGWNLRPVSERDEALAEVYGLPVDSVGKQGGLEVVARALDRGNLALASIGAVLLRFPDPPALTKDAPLRGSAELAAQLAAEGLLKADWDSSKHPRAGAPPNPGWFAATGAPSPPATRETSEAGPGAADDAPVASAEAAADADMADFEAAAGAGGEGQTGFWTWRRVLTAVRDALKSAGEDAIKTGRFALVGRFGVEARDRSGDRGALVDSCQP